MLLITNFTFAETMKVRVPKFESIKILKKGEIKQVNYTNIVLNIDCTYLDSKKSSIPKTYVEAVMLLDQWLDSSVIEVILVEDGNSNSFISRIDSYYDLGRYLEELWELKTDNSLSILFQKYGIYSTLPHLSFEGGNTNIFLDALLSGIYEYRINKNIEEVSILTRIGSYASIAHYDTLIVPTDPPKNCTANIESGDIVLDSRPAILAYRVIHWTKCNNDKIITYQWEKGWFNPDKEIVNKIKLLEKTMMCLDDCPDEL